ncbi:hypothetical protein NL676_012323 [Syzygium grande]|nr:hypothetical protein NL676_012323 [Syzygium grande]
MKNPVAVLMDSDHHDLKDGLRRLVVRLGLPRGGHRLPEQTLKSLTSALVWKPMMGTKWKNGQLGGF